ncbi:MAG: tRNA (N(6)-L-threonylcarbamoyladenosine(37)-C(2))-methylthiotransferase MtaB [Micavibrio aeruginosavorus]|uniref:tRNA (N(6)-L-threonylcarbamoyladenosine(37)-C(2))-methylthiotransferase MtaB n=1 Tax=Micavibrio aeruginosavorus TaxID=349221 RepID=A0A2W5HU68_9BACT|nr:MAG: tRNA (N(6)-L-threonylcarbamoyladenosine(37)-C(2))-methylthiotransferase MtaB [Micavibrio aeruginosavorus]
MSTEPKIQTFGCRLNAYESEVMKGHAKDAGLENSMIFNTCAVTLEAERQARQAIRKARKENPDMKIIVTGCAAQINPKMFTDMPEVDQVIGNDMKLKAETWGLKKDEKLIVNDIMSVRETASHLIEGFEGHSRAFIQVQNGCDHRCTFCIIPYGRGNSRSVTVEEITEQVRKLVAAGFNEIVMTGVDVTSYGKDLPGEPTLGQMIRRVLTSVPELPRLRLSSLDPVEIDDDLWRLIAEEPRLMPHLHMSLQAGDDMILKRMKRRHLRHDAIAMCDRARSYRPDMVFGCDIIAGFPTETDEMFENTYNLVRDCDLTFLHIFPYSPRPGTPAAKMPQVDLPIRKARAAKLRALGEVQMERFLKSHVGFNRQIIIENDNIGRTEHFASVKLNQNLPVGSLANINITGIENSHLIGNIVIA